MNKSCVILTCFVLLYNVGVKAQVIDAIAADTTVFYAAEKKAEFPDGIAKFYEYINKNVHYPMSSLLNQEQGKVLVQMVIEKNGAISNIHILRGVSPVLDKEAIRVISKSPKWNPAMQDGKQVRFGYALPVIFKRNPRLIINF